MSKFIADWDSAKRASTRQPDESFYSAVEAERSLARGFPVGWPLGISALCKELQASSQATRLWSRVLHCVATSGTCPAESLRIQMPVLHEFQHAAEELRKQHQRFRTARDILVRACRAWALATTGVMMPIPDLRPVDDAAVVADRVRGMETLTRTEAYDHSGLKAAWVENVSTANDMDFINSWVIKTSPCSEFFAKDLDDTCPGWQGLVCRDDSLVPSPTCAYVLVWGDVLLFSSYETAATSRDMIVGAGLTASLPRPLAMIGDVLHASGVMVATRVNKEALHAARLESDARVLAGMRSTVAQLREWWESDAGRGPWLPPLLGLPMETDWQTWAEEHDLFNDADRTAPCVERLHKHLQEEGFVQDRAKDARAAGCNTEYSPPAKKCIVS
jgi:hypothetical protein